VSFRTDGGRKLVYMEGLRFLVNGVKHTMDAVLCLNHSNPSYPTKLYLAAQMSAGVNWNETAHILGRHWYTFSWSGVSPDLPIFEILAAHLRALNPEKIS